MDDLDHSMCISDHDWLSFFEESEECCLLQASLACPDSSGLSDGDDLDFATCTYTPYNAEQAGEESNERQVVGEEFSSVVCSSEEENKVGINPKPEPKLPVTKDATSCAEKEHWFVTVNDNPTKYRKSASGTVVTKKRKRKKIWKDKYKDDEGHTCGNTDMTMPLKVPEELFSDSLRTEVNIAHFEVPCKGNRLHHLDVGNIRTKPTKTVRSGTCADMNQLITPDTEPLQDASSESHFMEPRMDLTCHGVYGDSALCFAIENRSEPTKIKLDSDVNITKLMETSATVFIQEKDPDLGCESSQTKLTMDSGVGVYFDTIESTKSPCFKLDITNDSNLGHIREEIRDKRIVKELEMDVTCLEDSYKDKMLQSAMYNTSNGTIVELDTTNNTTDLGAIHRKRSEIASESYKLEDLRYFGALCKEDSLDSVNGNYAESVDTAKPIDNPVIHTNSIESDDFSDVELFSSFSNDSEMYHSAAESMEDSCHPSIQNSPCNVSISINHGLEDMGMHSCLQRDSSRPHIDTSQIFPSAYPVTDNTPNDNSTCSDCTESTALSMSVDTPTSASNSSSSLGSQPESLPQREVTMESPEAFAKATGNNQPVYAISAFWDEMEKLTINDILHIRMGRCMLPVEEALNTNELMSTSCDIKSSATIIPESADLDTMDTADSDYCTNLNESKPDCSSCDFSTSDFEEEYWQFINSSRNSSPDLHDKSYQSQCTDCVSASEEETDEIGTPVPLEDRSGQKWSCESTFDSFDVAVPHQMRKTKSMYDVHALKTMEELSPQAFLNQSSCKSLEEPFNMNCRFEVATPIMCHADEQYQISFPKVFEYLFEDSKSKSEAMSVSVYGLQGNPVLPVNSYTFHATMNDQSLRNYREEPIPIFSCSRPTVRELTFPKPGCVFLGTNYTAIKDISPIQILSQSIVRGMDCRQTDRAFCFSQDLSSLYLVKSICFLDKGSDVWRYQSEDDEKSVDATDLSISVVGEGGVSTMTPQMFKEAALRQISMENNHIPSDYAQGIFSTIKQSDMCLVCIAFASWVLKSSDPEAADSWKAALLANVSALSAIQYLRQYMKKKASPQHD